MGWDERDERARSTIPSLSLLLIRDTRMENTYIRAYITNMRSNVKVISPVTCRSSVKYLMNPRPVETFLSALSWGTARTGPSVHFSQPCRCCPSRKYRLSIKSHSKRSCYNDIENEGPTKREDDGDA